MYLRDGCVFIIQCLLYYNQYRFQLVLAYRSSATLYVFESCKLVKLVVVVTCRPNLYNIIKH